MENKFDEVMRQRTDEELIRILNGPPDDYQPAALDAARRVFDSRNISSKQVADVVDQVERQQHEDAMLAIEPLETSYKVLAFIFPIRSYYLFPDSATDERYVRKNRERIRWHFYGSLFYGAIIFILILSEMT